VQQRSREELIAYLLDNTRIREPDTLEDPTHPRGKTIEHILSLTDGWLAYNSSINEMFGLLVFFHTAGGPHWLNATGWYNVTSPCQWYGIECDANTSRVTGIRLSSNNLTGKLNNGISTFHQTMRVLDFSDNQLS